MSKLPNLLLILADDHGQWATGCYGNQEVRTPNLDYLAESGVKFTNAFTPCPVCSPARASLFTGRIPSQHGVHDFLSEEAIDESSRWLIDERLLPELVQQQGYQTALIGKWHCTNDGHNPQPGFDYWFSYDVRERGWRNQYEHRGTVEISKQGQPTTIQGFQSQALTEEALTFLRHRDLARPFFLVLSLVDTHFPFAGQPERLVQQYRHSEQPHVDIPSAERSYLKEDRAGSQLPLDHHERVAQYYAGVTMMDHQVGTLLDELEGAGILDNTLVVYTSDHGHMNGHHGLYGKGNATVPQNFYEESIRIPLLLHWPDGELTQGPVTVPVDHCDLFATFLDAAHVILSPDETNRIHSPGRTILPLLRGQETTWRTYQCCEYGNARMITDLRYKLVRRYPPLRAKRHEEGAVFGDELFDLQLDPRETTNRIDECSCQALIGHLGEQLDAFYGQYEVPHQSGKDVLALPLHNHFEPWRSAH